jgi:hypothetical protein
MVMIKKSSKIRLNQKGQAALVDSIIFLTIVSAIVTMLFFFMIGYGDRVSHQLDSLYSEDFSIDTLKVITYINVLRDGRSVFDYDFSDTAQPSPEYDYLLALMKEDHADLGEFTYNTKKAVVSTVSSTLKPFEESIDYAFFLTHEDSDEFLLLLLAVHEGQFNDDGEVESVDRVYYDCSPDDRELLSKEIFPYVGEINSASGKIMLVTPGSDVENPQNIPYIFSLNRWVSKDIKVLQNLGEPTPGITDLNCVEITTEVEAY